jgi:hypothetical protein
MDAIGEERNDYEDELLYTAQVWKSVVRKAIGRLLNPAGTDVHKGHHVSGP